MRKKINGFTLVELIVSIALILLLFIISIPAGISLSNNAKKKECESIKNELLSAADLYVTDKIVNGNFISEHNTYVTLEELYDADLIEKEYKIDMNKTKIINGKWNGKSIKINLTKKGQTKFEDGTVVSSTGYYSYNLEQDFCIKDIDDIDFSETDPDPEPKPGSDETSKNEADSNKLADVVIKNNPPKTGYSFSENSTDQGLYTLNENENIKFFKGAVENNYVQFGKYKKQVKNRVWNSDVKNVEVTVVAESGQPIIWRVVRINEDKSVTLIAEHNIGDSYHIWNETVKADYVNPDGTDSNIKRTVETWYSDTIGSNTKLDNLVVKTDFCNDRSSSYGGTLDRLYKNSGRTNTPPEPTLKCAQESDIVKAKAGLITADEMVYAGALVMKKVINNTTYLDNKTNFWTISPYASGTALNWDPGSSCMTVVSTHVSSGFLNAARPVITLSSEASVTAGYGTSAAPWIIGG